MEHMSSVKFREFAQLFVHIGCWFISWRKCWVSLGELYVLWGNNCFEEKQHLLRRTWTEVHLLHDSGSFEAALRLYLKARQRVFAGKTYNYKHKYRLRRDLQCVKTNLSRTIAFYILSLALGTVFTEGFFLWGLCSCPWLEGTVKTGGPLRPL